ncbi:hypothetical protein SSX86_018204 [Deinandra increscens subsp. villosa]|uniref:Uncharacterized protein n=1 Tax=Deinandra increscens subsp. villosa TaxID=3103831 RepID=A0AAP0CQG8_9ASTR
MDDAIYVCDDVVESDVDNAQHVFEIEDGSDDDDDFEEDTGFAAKREIGLSILLCLIAKSKINFLTFIWNPSMEFEVALIIADYCMPPMTGFGLFRKIKVRDTAASMVDLEEAKGQEITKLQNALQEMQGKLDEAHNQIIHEKEAEKFAIEQAPPVIKEVPIVDYTKVEELENHNHEPESSRRELEFEQKYNEVENESKYRFKELEESQAKIPGLQETIESLKTKINELESENELLRNQQVVCGANNHPCKVITAASAYVDWFAWDNAKHPSTLRWPEQKKRFILSKWEAKRLTDLEVMRLEKGYSRDRTEY